MTTPLDPNGSIALSELTTEQQVTALYIGYFGRAPDPVGLVLWQQQLEEFLADDDDGVDGKSLTQIADSFAQSQESQDEYAYFNSENPTQVDAEAFINEIYLNLFDRPVDPTGLEAWSGQLMDGSLSAGEIILQIIDGARNQDVATIANKIEVGIFFKDAAIDAGLTRYKDDPDAKALSTVITDGVTEDPATVDAAKDSANEFFGEGEATGETFTLTEGTDIEAGGAGDDAFVANQSTLNTSDDLDGAEGDDVLEVSVENDAGSLFAAPTLNGIETIVTNGPNLNPGQNVTIDLSNAAGYETLRSFQTTVSSSSNAVQSMMGPTPVVSFLDIQDVNNTDIEIVDTDVDHLYTYDTNAFLSLNGGDDDAVDMMVQEVDGSTIDLELEDSQGARSHVDIVNLTSLEREQVNTTTFNYIHELNVGEFFNEFNVTGDADLEVEKFLDENVNDVDATTLDGELALDLRGQGERSYYSSIDGPQTVFNVAGDLQVLGAIGATRIDVEGDTNGTFLFQDAGDLLRVGNSSDTFYNRQNVFGHLDVVMAGGDDRAMLNITGIQDVQLGDGDDDLTINGNVDDLDTIVYNDGRSEIDAGAGDDRVELYGQTDDYTHNVNDLDNDYAILLGEGHDTLVANQGGDHTVVGGAGEDDIMITGNGSNVIDSGDDDDTVEVNGDGDQNVMTGAGDDDVLLNSNGDHTVSMGEGDDEGVINGVGVHDISLGDGDDSFTINGGRLPDNNIDNTTEDRQTTINAGDGDDYVGVFGDHFLLTDMGAGNDTVEMNSDELSADDFINGNTGIDTLVLNNESRGESSGRVGASETSAAPSFEIFDLLHSNIDLRLTSDNFDSTEDGHITVVTTNADEVLLPQPPIVLPDGLVVENGMSRADYDQIKLAYENITSNDFEDWLLSNGVNSIHFVDENADSDADVVSGLGGNPVDGDPDDTVDFQQEVEGDHTVDITDIPLSVASGRSFELQGGNIRDIVVADDASISGRLALDYDFSADTNQSAEDTLQVIDGAQITAADLRNVNGLEIMELMSTSNDAQTWDIELNDRVINQTTGNAPLIIRVDPDVPAGTQVNIQLDPSIWGATATNDVIIETVANAEIYIDGVLVTEPDFGTTDYNPGPLGMITVVERQVYTQNSDSLVGRNGVDDTFVVDSMSKLQAADSAHGNGDPAPALEILDQDVLLFDNVTVTNQGDDLFSQINRTELNSIEEFDFDTGLNVQMTSLDSGADDGILSGMLNTVRTGSGDDSLLQMEGIGTNWDEGYFLNGGDDIFTTEGAGGSSNDQNYYVDGGAGNDEVTVADEADLFGTDIEFVQLEGNADATVRTKLGLEGGSMTITGRPDTNDNNSVTLVSPFLGFGVDPFNVELYDIETVTDNYGFSNIRLDNDRTGAADSDADIDLQGGNDTLVVTNVQDLTVQAGGGFKNVNVGGSTLSNVTNFTYTGGVGVNGGLDNIVAVVDHDVDINAGDLADTIDVTTTAIGPTVLGTVNVNGQNGNDIITVDSILDADVSGGNGNDVINVTAHADTTTVSGGAGDDDITVVIDPNTPSTDPASGAFFNFIASLVLTPPAIAEVNGGAGNDTISVSVQGDDTSTIDTGLGIDEVTLLDDANGGADTIVFGDIVYDVQQEVDTGVTTQNFTQKGVDDPTYTGSANDGIDTITGFNMESGGAGAEDLLDVSAFATKFVSGDAIDAADDFHYGDWTTGGQTALEKVGSGAGAEEVAVIAVDDGFELDASHVKQNAPSTDPGVYVGDNDARVVITAYDTDGDNAFDMADVYFVQDVDQDAGVAWAVDKVATIEFATEIGAITSIDEDNIFSA